MAKPFDIVPLTEYTGHGFSFRFDQQHFYPGKKMSKIVIVQNLLPHSLGRIKQKKPHNNNYGEWIPRKNLHGYCTQLQTNAEISSFTA